MVRVKHISREAFFSEFLQSGSIDDLQDPVVRKLVDKGHLAVKTEKGIFATKGARLLDADPS
jgi:hypothetical protein